MSSGGVAEDRSALDSLPVAMWGGMIGAWRTKLECSVWPSAVVVGAVPGEDASQVPYAEDQDAVGEFGSGGQDEALGEAVRSRTSRRNLHDIYAGAGQGCVERGGELAGAVADEEPEVAARSLSSIIRLRACWVVHAPVGWLVVPSMCT